MNSKLFRRLEFFGPIVVFMCAVFLHFFYELSGRRVIGALFGSVNESIWEHLKIFGIPYIGYGLIVALWARPPLKAFVPAKSAGIIVLWLGITASQYISAVVFSATFTVMHILSAVFFTVVAHFISYKITLFEHKSSRYFYTGLMIILLVLMMMLCFTYFPIQNSLFIDPVTKTYGINSAPEYKGAQLLDKLYEEKL